MTNRINQTSIGVTADRQTPQNDFGAMLARGIANTAQTVGGAAGMIAPGGAVISAAISQVAGRVANTSGGSYGVGGGGGTVGGTAPAGQTTAPGGATTAGGSAPATDGLDGQKEMMAQNQKWTAQYLALQNDMQRESREFNAVSNIMKVRHESAKTAINNIR